MTSTVIGIICAVAGAFVGILIGMFLRKAIAEKKIGSAEAEAKRIIKESFGKRNF